MRWVMTRVLPVPAPARIRIGPSVASTASRCWGFRLSRMFIFRKFGALGRMHFSRAEPSEQIEARDFGNKGRSVGRRIEINLEEKERLRAVHEGEVGDFQPRVGNPVV